jgi:hypothetical protein
VGDAPYNEFIRDYLNYEKYPDVSDEISNGARLTWNLIKRLNEVARYTSRFSTLHA